MNYNELSRYLDVHYEIVMYITISIEAGAGPFFDRIEKEQGKAGLYKVAKEWTDNFLMKHQDFNQDQLEDLVLDFASKNETKHY